MIRNILVGLDGGPLAERSLPWSKCLIPEARLTLARAYVPIFAGADPWMDDSGFALDTNRLSVKMITSYLEKIASRLKPRPSLILRPGSAAGVLLDATRGRKYDLLAITTHGGQRLKRRLVGGTVEQLIHHARVPLFVVPASAGNRSGSEKIRRIAVPLDGSKSAESILPLAEDLARNLRAELLLIHVFENLAKLSWESGIWAGGLPQKSAADRFKDRIRQVQKSLRDRFEELSRGIEKRGGRARALLVSGTCPETLVSTASKYGCDMMAMCVHGHGALEHLLQGSMTSKILQITRIPVLLARDDKLKQRASSHKQRTRRRR